MGRRVGETGAVGVEDLVETRTGLLLTLDDAGLARRDVEDVVLNGLFGVVPEELDVDRAVVGDPTRHEAFMRLVLWVLRVVVQVILLDRHQILHEQTVALIQDAIG